MKTLSAIALLFAGASAQAGILTYYANLAPEVAGASGSGYATVTFDEATHVLSYSGEYTGLSGLATQAHFHCCTATPFTGTAGIAVDSPRLLGVPIGVSAASFADSLDLDDAANFNPAFVTASGGTTDLAIARLIAGFSAHTAYLNIHSTTFGGGEIRGFLVPEPASAALAMLALGAAGFARRRA